MLKSYKDWLKILSRKPMNIFWILLFPIILVTLFKMTMGSQDIVSSFSEKIKIEYIKNNKQIDSIIETAVKSEELTNYYEFSFSEKLEETNEKVKNQEIDGYIYVEENEDKTYTLIVRTGYDSFANSMIETFAQNFVNTANKFSALIRPMEGQDKAIRQGDYTKHGEEIYKQDDVPSLASIYTYPAIVYSILFTGLIVQYSIRSMSSNMSYRGMRVEASGQKKSKTFISAILASFTVGFVALILLTIYIQFILKIDIGFTSHFVYLMLIYIVGLVVSIMLSSMIVMLTPKKDENTQGNILITVLMLMYFFSGGMVGNLALIIKKSVPLLYYINPAALLSDSIGYLLYKENLQIIWINLGIVMLSGIVYLMISIFALRRKKNELF